LNKYKETNILYNDRRYFKVWLGNLDTGLQVQGKTGKYRSGFLEKNCKDLQNTKSKKRSNERKNGVKKNNFGETGKQYVEVVWTCSTHGG